MSGIPGYLNQLKVDMPGPNTSSRRTMARFGPAKSNKINVLKQIVHPGEVNRVVASPHDNNIVATHSDSSLVYLWDFSTVDSFNGQVSTKTHADEPTLTLCGHNEKAEYCLSFSKSSQHLLSGGSDHNVCIWDLDDGESTLNMGGTKLEAAYVLEGHTGVVEDGYFHPEGLGRTLVTVGDDRSLICWDTRDPNLITQRLADLHTSDINCCSWNLLDSNYILTGGSDKCVRLLDYRKLGDGAVHTIVDMDSAVMNLKWSPHEKDFFACTTTGLQIWNVNYDDGISSKLFLSHPGHQTEVAAFDWSSSDPWTFVTVSDVDAETDQFGSLQCWRVSELLTNRSPEFLHRLEAIYDKAA